MEAGSAPAVPPPVTTRELPPPVAGFEVATATPWPRPVATRTTGADAAPAAPAPQPGGGPSAAGDAARDRWGSPTPAPSGSLSNGLTNNPSAVRAAGPHPFPSPVLADQSAGP